MYNYQKATKWLESKGQELFGNHFKIYDEDKTIIHKLMAYSTGDEEVTKQLDINLEKGILLSGPIGCGKTTLMTLMKHLATPQNKYYVKSCREVGFEFIKEGYDVIIRYSKPSLHQSKVGIICFDDLGTENNLKYFGNECNVMGEILLSRYDLFISKKVKTHLTTNLSASELEHHYGNRVRSRLRESFNLIAFNNNSKDKRR
ncbi:ATPase family protein associated with various cellular activities (AAA) [Oceanihabitans sediminis]|uniref:AAA family ATPase n=1 Tax=Oceanihabitans sediminis TaxID=1812012 RepID=A0A368P469_9FLAO|nr:AAA family ATPase [Oceanihabitans sediminis]RBP32800.1 ATPase family protein associated with various cellular activities (AAA) [Oceanihabitans sediminis]RCU57667.1 AAA family ATPase [Oceanihabitans sediminis]